MIALGLLLETVVPMVTSTPPGCSVCEKIASPGAPDAGVRGRRHFGCCMTSAGDFCCATTKTPKVAFTGLLRPGVRLVWGQARFDATRRSGRIAAADLAGRGFAPQQVCLLYLQATQRGLRQQRGCRQQRADRGAQAASAGIGEPHPHGPMISSAPAPATAFDLYPAADARAMPRLHPRRLLAAQFARALRQAIAEGLAQTGWSVAMPGDRRLAPHANMTTIVQEIGAALDWLADHGRAHGLAGPVVLAGWSAGAQPGGAASWA